LEEVFGRFTSVGGRRRFQIVAQAAPLFGRSIKPKHIAAIDVPPPSLQGRGGAIRIKHERTDMLCVIGYLAPLTDTSRGRLAQEKGPRFTWNGLEILSTERKGGLLFWQAVT